SLEQGENLPNVILLDINMPEMDGWQFIEEFRTLKAMSGHKTAIYISSSSISAEDTAKAESYEEISSYLIKPIEPKTLLNIVQKNWENRTS
ncbi:MAG: response regulator, partial [Cytophagales bacterium]|nr:response regulator [Cytophagales bacterium]